MNPESKEQFLAAIFRMKKAVTCFPQSSGLQSSELAVLCQASVGCTREEKGYTVSEIQQSLHISKPAVSQVLNSLERKQYIVRAMDVADRRKITVTITSTGEERLRDAMMRRNEILDEVFRQFGEERILLFIRSANQLMDIFDAINKERERNE